MATSQAVRRVDELARSKPIPPGFIEDRRSIYWVDRLPPQPGPDGTTLFVLTPRQEQLIAHKNLNPSYKFSKPSPIWAVSPGALKATATPRIEQMARHKECNSDYQYDRSVYTAVREEAKKALASGRLEQLAQPKGYKTIKEEKFWDWGDQFSTTVAPAALNAKCSTRIEVLAESKQPNPQFFGEKSIQWPVSRNAMKAIATLRVQQLARPKSRGTINDDYDPYRVTIGAKNARPTPRIDELAVPLQRKCRQKKVFATPT